MIRIIDPNTTERGVSHSAVSGVNLLQDLSLAYDGHTIVVLW
jgi:hypothetical protein